MRNLKNIKDKFITNFINNVIDFIEINKIEIDSEKLFNYNYGLLYFKNFFYEIIQEMHKKEYLDDEEYKYISNETTEFDILLIYSSDHIKKLNYNLQNCM